MDSVERVAPRVHVPSAVASLRRRLLDVGFTPEGVKPAMVRVTRGHNSGPLDVLVRLFMLRAEVPLAEAELALAPLSVATCAELGLVTTRGASLVGTVELTPEAGDLIFASDWSIRDPSDLHLDQVMAPARSTRRLAALTIRRVGELALDLGAGCGYHAILAARHASHVVATDVTSRALAFTVFNALLNVADNVECRLGNWFEAVDGESFDLLVSNPPYVIAPERTLLFQDDDVGHGGLSRSIVTSARDYLRPDGLAHVLVGWTHGAEQSWVDPLREWVEGTGCDAWLLREASYDPPSYAALWNAPLAADHATYASAINRWTDYYAEQGVARIADGAIVLRRRQAGVSRVRFDNLPPGDLSATASEDLAARIAAEDVLDELDEAALLERRLDVTPEHRLEQVLRHGQAGYEVAQATLILERGLCNSLACNTLFVRLLGALDGRRQLGEAIDAAAPADLSPDAAMRFRSAALPAVRHAISHGFVRLAD